MKIEGGWKRALIGDICSGTLFYYRGKLYIATNRSLPPINKDMKRYCVDIDEGALEELPYNTMVAIVEDVVLKIGGYYK